MTEEQAGNIVYELFGGIIESVQIAVSGENTYIAALRQPYQNSDQGEIILLRSFGTGFIKQADVGTAYLSCGGFEELLLNDLNNDGFIDVYWQYQCGGNALNSIDFNIYDTSTSQVYNSTLHTNYSPSADIVIDENLPLSFLPFLEAKVTVHPQFLIPLATNEPPELNWRDLYGAFTKREMVAITLQKEFKPLSADVTPLNCSISAEATLDNWQYISCFKDAVYAVNQEQGIYFVVYAPDTTYDWITELSIYEGLLVIPERNDPSIVTFNPITFDLLRHNQ